MSSKIEPINIGTKFEDKGGNIWEVIEKLPFGRIELFDRKRVRFMPTYQKQIREGRFTRIHEG